jgi:hypothetical protein
VARWHDTKNAAMVAYEEISQLESVRPRAGGMGSARAELSRAESARAAFRMPPAMMGE